MPTLTRRRAENPHRETWNIYYGDLHVGTIGERAGVPKDQNQWSWLCGIFGIDSAWKQGEGADFEACRSAFQLAWDEMRPQIGEEQAEGWRNQRDWTAWKYRMRDQGFPLPAQLTSGRARCFCGAEITTADTHSHATTAHRGIGA